MGKTRDLVKKIRDTKGTFHAKTSTIKDRNSTDLTEAEVIKKRWQEYTEHSLYIVDQIIQIQFLEIYFIPCTVLYSENVNMNERK